MFSLHFVKLYHEYFVKRFRYLSFFSVSISGVNFVMYLIGTIFLFLYTDKNEWKSSLKLPKAPKPSKTSPKSGYVSLQFSKYQQGQQVKHPPHIQQQSDNQREPSLSTYQKLPFPNGSAPIQKVYSSFYYFVYFVLRKFSFCKL